MTTSDVLRLILGLAWIGLGVHWLAKGRYRTSEKASLGVGVFWIVGGIYWIIYALVPV